MVRKAYGTKSLVPASEALKSDNSKQSGNLWREGEAKRTEQASLV